MPPSDCPIWNLARFYFLFWHIIMLFHIIIIIHYINEWSTVVEWQRMHPSINRTWVRIPGPPCISYYFYLYDQACTQAWRPPCTLRIQSLDLQKARSEGHHVRVNHASQSTCKHWIKEVNVGQWILGPKAANGTPLNCWLPGPLLFSLFFYIFFILFILFKLFY